MGINEDVKLIHGNCLDALKGMQDNSVDSIVTDPPYGLSFMGKKWDYDVPDQAIWEECLRVLKPGGHLLSFAGARTQHRMAVRIEDAGFEIRDMIAWVYGSGFPKSMAVSKAIDKAAGVRGHDSTRFNAVGRQGERRNSGDKFRSDHLDYVRPQAITDAARQWQGWGTALKPALEPITVARKPLKGTVADNVLEWGTGAINVDGCRVEGQVPTMVTGTSRHGGQFAGGGVSSSDRPAWEANTGGRWPANLIHDGSDEVITAFPEAKGQQGKSDDSQRSQANCYGTTSDNGKQYVPRVETDKSAARFFYCAKTSRKDRGESNNHPTVKPTDLMAYLCRLVTPPGGVVLDPFMGSGSTGKAAVREGFRFIGIEMDADYLAIAEARISHEAGK